MSLNSVGLMTLGVAFLCSFLLIILIIGNYHGGSDTGILEIDCTKWFITNKWVNFTNIFLIIIGIFIWFIGGYALTYESFYNPRYEPDIYIQDLEKNENGIENNTVYQLNNNCNY